MNRRRGPAWRDIGCKLVLTVVAAVVTSAPRSGAAQTGPVTSSLADMSMEELMNVRVERVFGAAKLDQKVTQAPASVSVITATEIRRFGYRTLADILRSLRGMYISYDSVYSYFGSRGFLRPGDYNSRVLLLVDGHRLNDDLFGQAMLGTEEVVDVDLIERVELVRGPGSSIYGNNAFFGVINIITRSPTALHGLEASAAAGSLGARQGRLTYGDSTSGGLSVLFSGSLGDIDGHRALYYPQFDTPQTNDGVAAHSDSDHSQSLFGLIKYGDLSLEAGYSLRGKQIPVGIYGTVFDHPQTQNWDSHSFADLKYSLDVAALQLRARLYFDRYSFYTNYPFDVTPLAASAAALVVHDGDYSEGAGAQLELTRTVFDLHTLLAGVEVHDSPHLYQSEYHGTPWIYDFRDDQSAEWVGLYTQDQLTLRKDLLLNAGLRYDHYSSFGAALSPRIGLIYNPTADSAVKLLYGQAYQTPNAFQLYFAVSGLNPNPRLKPETIRTYELDYEKYLPGNTRFSVSAYHYRISKLIEETEIPSGSGITTYENAGTVSSDGIEMEIEYKPDNGMLARASYALQRAHDETGQGLDNSPRHLLKSNLLLPLHVAGLFAGLEAQYTSSMLTLQRAVSPGFLLVNGTLSSSGVIRNLDIAASIYNIFNRSYTYPGSSGIPEDLLEQDGRTLRLKLTYRF